MAKRALPTVPYVKEVNLRGFLLAVKENIEIMNGSRGGGIDALSNNATDAEVIAKVNELIEYLQER